MADRATGVTGPAGQIGRRQADGAGGANGGGARGAVGAVAPPTGPAVTIPEPAPPPGVTVVVDAAGAGGARVYLPDRPALRPIRPGGPPAFSLTVVLSRTPRPDEPSIGPLVQRASVAFTASLAAPDTVASAADAAGSTPLFAQRAAFALVDSRTGTTLASGWAIGTEASAALAASLDRARTIDLLGAIDGAASALVLVIDVTYRRARPGLAASTRTLSLRTPLDRILPEALAGYDRNRFVSLVAEVEGAAVPRTVPRLVESGRPRGVPGGNPNGGGVPPLRLAALGGAPRSFALALTPDRGVPPKADALIASDLTYRLPIAATHIGIWAADDAVLDAPSEQQEPESLPVIDDPSAPFWIDRADATKAWYAPGFELAQPAPNEDPAGAPFLFTFTTAGVTSGGSLSTGLDATVRFTIDQTVPAATASALAAAGRTASPVPLGNLSVTLAVPFRDQASGESRTQTFAGTVEQRDASLVVTVELLNDWVRLCYGALAFPGFQAEPAHLLISYAYRAYTPVSEQEPPHVYYGGKINSVGLVGTAAELPAHLERPMFVAADRSLHTPSAVLRLEPEAPSGTGTRAMPVPGRLGVGMPLIGHLPPHINGGFDPAPVTAEPPIVAVHPPIQLEPPIIAPRYVARSLVQQTTLDATYPCSSLGAFYRQADQAGDLEGTSTSVGCQDALRLGQASPKLFDEMIELADPKFRVFRSLQQPGRFLLLPAAFRITRYGPSEPSDRAYRPVILVYATLDPTPANSRYFFTATLQPDVPYFARRRLMDRLIASTPDGRTPILDLPISPSVQATPTYRWAVPDVMDQPQVLAAWDSLQVSVSAGLADALTTSTIIQTSGLAGSVSFALSDGSTLTSTLVIDTQVGGPWDRGPVEVTPGSGIAAGVTMTNRIEQSVSVTDVVIAGVADPVSVDATIAPGASASVNLPAGAAQPLDAYPIYAVAPGHLTLQQLDVFTEDLTAQVLFVNLVNYSNHDLTSLDLALRLQGSPETHQVALAENQTTSVDVVFPLDSYLRSQTIEFQVTKTPTSGAPSVTAWTAWDLAQGTVIDITWDRLQ